MKRVITVAADTVDEVRRGLLRTPHGDWLHVFRTGETINLRPLSEQGAAPRTHTPSSLAQTHGGSQFIPYDVLRWYVEPSALSPGRISHAETEYWRSLARRYEDDPELCMPPQLFTTDLRLYYERLRASAATTAKDGESITESVTALSTLLASAMEKGSVYRNLREGWAPENARKRMDDSKFARDVALRCSLGDLMPPPGFEYAFVERELAPLRATGAGVPDSGGGGIDVLLASDDEACLPIVVEVKSAGDTSFSGGLTGIHLAAGY